MCLSRYFFNSNKSCTRRSGALAANAPLIQETPSDGFGVLLILGSVANLGQDQRLINGKFSYARKPIISSADQFLFGKRRFEIKKLLTTTSRSAAILAVVATTFSGSVISQSAPYPTAETVQQALVEKMGDKAKALSVTVDQGTVRLSGWVHGPREVHQARYLVSKIPGVERAYSSGVFTWVTTDSTPVF